MMTSNICSTEPANPVLAHSLLPQSPPQVITPEQPIQGSITSEWNLNDDLMAGIKSCSSGILRCGPVIGFSRLKMRSSDNDEYTGEIPRHLLTTHLRRNPPSSETNTFIIYPSSFDAFAARNLFNDLQSGTSGLSRDDAIKCLDSVQLLPVHNLPNAAQAIKQVSELLQKAQERHQQQDASSSNRPIIILLVVGLDALAESVVRASNPARGAAVLASTLRILTRMSRTHSDFLSIILVNTNGLGPSHFEFDKEGSNKRNIAPSEDRVSSRHDGTYSMFQMPGHSLLSTLLMKTLDQGIDTHILLSDVKYARVAEVIKDRTGPGLGKWGIWSPQR